MAFIIWVRGGKNGQEATEFASRRSCSNLTDSSASKSWRTPTNLAAGFSMNTWATPRAWCRHTRTLKRSEKHTHTHWTQLVTLSTKTQVNWHKSLGCLWCSSARVNCLSPGAPDLSKASNCVVCTANSATSNWRPKLAACWYKPLSCCSSKHGYQTMTLEHWNLTKKHIAVAQFAAFKHLC